MKNRLLSPRECQALGVRYVAPSRIKNGCGVRAVMKAWELASGKIPSRVLQVENGNGAHAILVYRAPDGTCFAFDEGGSFPLPGVTERSNPLSVARAFLKQMSRIAGKDLRPVTRAAWSTE